MRQDYIETDYINGAYNAAGERVIRPLNADEKEFLNSFYEEVVGANFLHDTELRKLHEKRKDLKKIENPTKQESQDLKETRDAYYKRADEVLLYTEVADQRKLYGENNSRNRCIYNRTKSIGILDELNDGTYDEFHRNVYNHKDAADTLLHAKVEPRIKSILRKQGTFKKPK